MIKLIDILNEASTSESFSQMKNLMKNGIPMIFPREEGELQRKYYDKVMNNGDVGVFIQAIQVGDPKAIKLWPKVSKVIKKKKIKERGRNIAKTILQQLGGNKFIAMTGAKNLGFTNNGLQMKIGRNSKGITHVVISLKSTDTYDVEFIKMRGVNRKVVKKLKRVYADQLGKIFTKYTGLRIRLQEKKMKLTKSKLKEVIREVLEEETINEINFDKIKLPSVVNRFLGKFVDSMKGANLNRMKRAAILFKVIDAAGMTPQQLMADIQKIKTAMKND